VAPTEILYCIDRLDRGGTESQLSGLISRLDRYLFRPRVCTLRGGGELAAELDCPWFDLDMPGLLRPGAWSRLIRLKRHIRENRIRVVQTFFQDAAVVGLIAARMAGVPVRVTSFRDLGFWRTPAQEFVLRRVYPLATGFLANSESVARHFRTRDRLPAGKFRIIPNGVDSDRISFVDHSADALLTVGLISNLNRPVKKPELFLEAAARIGAKRSDVRWLLVGDGSLREGLERQAAELGIADSVTFTGRVEDVPARLAGIAVGVNCSDSEGFANSVLEYMLGGCAVVATSVGGNLEIVRDGETGLLVPPGNSTALAAAIDSLLESPALRKTLTERARSEAVTRFGWDRCVKAHQEYYTAALESASRRGRG